MTETHQAWLAQMELESRAKQEQFMKGIAGRLGHPRLTTAPPHPFRGAPDFWQSFEWSSEEKVQHFTDNFESAGGHVQRVSDMQQVQSFICSKATELSARYMIHQNEVELNHLQLKEKLENVVVSKWNRGNDEDWIARAAEADIGIVMADYAVSHTGSIVVVSSEDKGRSVSLLPTALIAIIPLERFRTRLGEVLTTFDEMRRDQLPAGIHFISGPSRSADIENDLTIGVHGPGIVFAVIVG
ncbi:LutC/YkgG family protein [Paenibacillus sp. CMAA1364]